MIPKFDAQRYFNFTGYEIIFSVKSNKAVDRLTSVQV